MSGPLDLKAKRICVTGSSGLLGRAVIEALRRRGAAYLILPRSRDFDLRTGDAFERLFAEHRPDVVIHLAALVGGIAAIAANPGTFFYDNAIMGIQLIEYARRYDVKKIVMLGSVCAYPVDASVPIAEGDLWSGYSESTVAPYGIAKRILLEACQAYRRQYGTNAIYLLPVNLYGPHDNFDAQSSHVVPALIRKAIEAREKGAAQMTCWGDGTPTREFLYVDDCAEGVLLAAEGYDGAEPANLAGGEEIAIRDLVALINELVGYQGEVVWDPSRPNGQMRRSFDAQRAEHEFGFKAKTPLRDGLRRTIDWYVAQRAAAVA